MSAWTCAAEQLPGLRGQGFYLIAPVDRAEVEKAVRAADYDVRVAEGTANAASTMAAICRALGVQVATNLDSFADVLRDVTPAGAGSRVALVWNGAELLAGADLASWLEFAEILTGASAEHWDPENDDDPDNLVFETVAVTAGFGVKPLS